jgi:hypothetical protein
MCDQLPPAQSAVLEVVNHFDNLSLHGHSLINFEILSRSGSHRESQTNLSLNATLSFDARIVRADSGFSYLVIIRELPTLHSSSNEGRFEKRIPDLKRSLPEERRGLREADALYRGLVFRRFEQTLFA